MTDEERTTEFADETLDRLGAGDFSVRELLMIRASLEYAYSSGRAEQRWVYSVERLTPDPTLRR